MGVCYTSPHWLFHFSYIQMHVSYTYHEDVNNVPWIAAGHELYVSKWFLSQILAELYLCRLLFRKRERERLKVNGEREKERSVFFYSSSLFPPPRLKTSKPSIWVSCSGRDGFWCVRNNLAPTVHTFFSIASYMKHSKWHEKKVWLLPLAANNAYHKSGSMETSCQLSPFCLN